MWATDPGRERYYVARSTIHARILPDPAYPRNGFRARETALIPQRIKTALRLEERGLSGGWGDGEFG